MEMTLSSEEYRKFDEELKELIYSCFYRWELIIFPNAKAKTAAKSICRFIVEKLIRMESEKPAAYLALELPITHLVRKHIGIGTWLLTRKPFFIGAIYREITEYLISGGIIKLYYPAEL